MARLDYHPKRSETLLAPASLNSGNKQINYQSRRFVDQFSKLSSEATRLRQTIRTKNQQIDQLKELIQKYKNFLIKETNYLELQQLKIALIHQHHEQIQSFVKDVDLQISNFQDSLSNRTDATIFAPLKRILSRFLSQKKFFQHQIRQHFENLDEKIAQCQQSIEKIKDEIAQLDEQVKEI